MMILGLCLLFSTIGFGLGAVWGYGYGVEESTWHEHHEPDFNPTGRTL